MESQSHLLASSQASSSRFPYASTASLDAASADWHPIESVLKDLGYQGSRHFAHYGPTAPARLNANDALDHRLPLTKASRDALKAKMYHRLLSADVGLVLDPAEAEPRLARDPTAYVDTIQKYGWSLAKVQQSISQLREQHKESTRSTHNPFASASSAFKGKAPQHRSHSSSSNSTMTSAAGTPQSSRPSTPAPIDPTSAPEYGEERRGMPCGHVFEKGEAIWRCRDCALDDTCVQCAPCFNASIHVREGHDVVFSVSSSSGGCCDCGDEEAWKQDVCCGYHSVQRGDTDMAADEEANSTSDSSRPPDVAREVHDALHAEHFNPTSHPRISQLLATWIDFILIVLNHAPNEQKLFPRSFARASAQEATKKVDDLPDLRQWGRPEAASSAPAGAKKERDSLMSPEVRTPLPPGAFDAFDLYVDADGPTNSAGAETPGMKWGTLPPSSPAVLQQGGHEREYALILWNDEKHSFREVIDTVKEALDVSDEEARAVAERVDVHGRDILAVSTDSRAMVGFARRMAGIDLEVTIRPGFDVYCEEVAHALISVIKDLAEGVAYLPRSNSDPYGLVNANASIPRLLLCSELLKTWDASKRQADSFLSNHMSTEFFDPRELTRLDGLLLMDQKLWKEARAWVRGWYMTIIARKEGRRSVAFHFAAMYPKIIETFILREREPEHSVVLMTVQLFSVPSIGSDLVRHYNFLQRLLLILQSIYTGQLIPPTGTLMLPAKMDPMASANPQCTLLRQIYCRHVFYDARYLLQAEGVQQQIVADERHLEYFLDFLSLFHSFLPEARQTQHHVEYESEVWVAVFGVCQLLARKAKLFGEAYEKAPPAAIARAFVKTVERINLRTHAIANRLAGVSVGGELCRVIDFAVEREETSFHHPMHWLLAELSRRMASLTQRDIQTIGHSSLQSLACGDIDQSRIMIALDFPLRVIVKLAQVRAGIWVRNGASTRGQAAHYRDVAMRSSMYDQDVFLMQAGLAFLKNPEELLVTIIDRYRLLEYFDIRRFNHTPEADPFDHEQQHFFAEEFLFFLITMLSETSMVHSWPIEKVIRREMVHFLALNQGTYSALTRHIPEHISSHPSFEKILAQVSNFKAPDGTTDLGIFELKAECYKEIDPFFFHFSRNQRERADEQLRAREKKAGRNPDSMVTVPLGGFAQETSPMSLGVSRLFTSRIYQRILICALIKGYIPPGASSANFALPEAVVDAGLQLVMIGIVEAGDTFIETVLAAPLGKMTAIHLLCSLEESVKIPALKARITWCLDKVAKVEAATAPQAAAALSTHRKVTAPSQAKSGANSLEARRAAAKARQQAIMKDFNARQKTLMDKFGGDDEEADKSGATAVDDDMEVDDEQQGEDEDLSHLGSCIMCQEQLRRDSPFGSLALVTPSMTIRTTPRNSLAALNEVVNDVPLTLDRLCIDHEEKVQKRYEQMSDSKSGVPFDPQAAPASGGFPRGDHKSGFVASTCGHLMHVRCFDSYYRSIEQRHASQIARNQAEDLSRSEFVCPLCKSLGNILLPVPIPPRRSAATSPATPGSGLGDQRLDRAPIGDWLRKINIDILKTSGAHTASSVQEMTTGTGCFSAWYADSSLSSLWDPASIAENPDGIDESTLIMLDRIFQVLKPLASSTRHQRVAWQSRTILAPISRKMYIPEELVAYTISMLEVSQRGIESKGNNVADGLSDTSVGLLRSLVFALRSVASLQTKGRGQASLRQGLLKRLLPHWSSDEAVRFPLLLRDPLAILVEAAAIVPEYFTQVTTLMYYATLVQTVFGLAQPSVWPQAGAQATAGSPQPRGLAHISGPSRLSAEEKAALLECFPDVRWTVGNIVGFVGYARGNITLGVDSLDDVSLAKMLCTYTLPFLRRAAILKRTLCGTSTGDGAGSGRDGGVEYLRLLRDLEIVPPSQALPVRAERQAPISSIVEGWIKHCYAPLASLFRPLPIAPSPLSSLNEDGLATSQHASPSHPTLQLEHPAIYELVHLPLDLTTLFQYTQRTVCRRCRTIPPDPALCLLCGELVCYQNFCCMDQSSERGECNRHVAVCGGNVGLFFKIKANVIFALYYSNGMFSFSPYLDSHGEVDVGLQKGRPQRLHRKRYLDLTKLWLTGGSGIGSLVSRKLESIIDVGGWITT
ncbi:hypothetical protein BDZ90DRAFT_232210 [Jaminaea rosea]|uniref:E3 ubiquitin-protein ligase n=1 Tax=Jaminaea rosea TaxID=1569628 RepID=A0A316URA0_9BASI|nr:hypothetical protein BDZ90DRAFT_232210 [Jaminaea rosea]PWN27822.1 hypothetical protein BDZ90DRAFT_232210 [Jaminaea rosea]